MPVVNWLSWLLSEGKTEGNKSPRLEILVEERIPFHVIKSQRKSFVWLGPEAEVTAFWYHGGYGQTCCYFKERIISQNRTKIW